jgi:CBS domain-containing protein/sporulation protein YlmC with PRC-barrel domain
MPFLNTTVYFCDEKPVERRIRKRAMAKIQNFLFFADILRFKPVDGISGKKIGVIDDIFAIFEQTYPRISGLMLRMNGRQSIKIPWKNVQKIDENARTLAIDMSARPDEPNGHDVPKNETLLKKTFFDKQIVNMLGSKVVRVNDLHLLREDTNLWLVHIDVGIKGLLRRLGWLNFFTVFFEWLISYDLKDKFISWKYAQAIPTPGIPSLPYLQIPSTKLSELHPADLAEILADLGNDERITFFRTLDNSTAARTLQEMPLNIQIQLVESINPKRIADIINEMQMDEVVDMLAKLSHGKVQELYSYLPAETVGEIKDLLKHSWHGAGSLMNTEFIAVKKDLTAGEVVKKIRDEFSKVESIYYIYILDDDETVIGLTNLRELLMADPATPLSELMQENIVKVDVEENIKNVARVFFKYNFTAVPVVDESNHMLGIISMKDALEAVFPEMKEEVEG